MHHVAGLIFGTSFDFDIGSNPPERHNLVAVWRHFDISELIIIIATSPTKPTKLADSFVTA